MASSDDRQRRQIELAQELQDLLLEDFRAMLKGEKEMTASDRATLTKLLKENGWNLDPLNLPQKVKDKLTANVDPTAFDETEDEDVVPLRKRA